MPGTDSQPASRQQAGGKDLIVRALAIATITSLLACSTAPPERAPSAEFRYRSIALVSPQDVLDATRPKTTSQKAQEGAGKGAIGGTLGGAALGAVACGPFLYGLCVSVLAGTGFLAGGATGMLYGFTGFSREVAKTLEQRVELLSSDHDLQSLLVDHIRQQVAPEMLAAPEVADVQAVLIIENIEFIKKGDKAFLLATVKASYQSTESRRVPEHGTRVFTGQSDKVEIGKLLDKDSDALRQAMRQSLLAVADQVVAAMNYRWEPGTTEPSSRH